MWYVELQVSLVGFTYDAMPKFLSRKILVLKNLLELHMKMELFTLLEKFIFSFHLAESLPYKWMRAVL